MQAIQAIQQAQTKLKRHADIAVLTILFASPEYNPQDIQNGATAQLRNTPFIGFSTLAQLNETSQNSHSVTAIMIAGDELQARCQWIENNKRRIHSRKNRSGF